MCAKGVRDEAKDKVDKHYENTDCQAYNDFRELLARNDIDAVHVATPDHWHAIIVIEACRSGKDVYCQKPETRTLREGPLMVEAARRYSRVVSGGSQRVLEDYRGIVDPCWGGELGTIKSINVNVGPLSQPCNLPAEDVPPGHGLGHVARSRTLGALQQGPLRRQLRHQRRQLAIVHRLFRRRHDRLGRASFRRRDVRRRCAGIAARGSHLSTTKTAASTSSFRYPNGLLIYHNRPDTGNLQVEGTPDEKRPAKPVPAYKGTGGIYGDFIECVKTRERPFRDIELAVNTVTLSHLGIIAYTLQRSLKWDAAKQEFPGDEEANRFLDRARREPWQL